MYRPDTDNVSDDGEDGRGLGQKFSKGKFGILNPTPSESYEPQSDLSYLLPFKKK